MVLNTDDLYKRIFEADIDNLLLSITPSPDRTTFRDSGSASVDLKLGRWFRTMRQNTLHIINKRDETLDADFTDEHFIPFSEEFILHPGKFVLGTTLEWLRLPNDLAGHVTGKSSWGRRGLIIETAAGIHPGFVGCLTLELANVGEIPIALCPGDQICQVFFHKTVSCGKGNRSQFNSTRRPMLGRLR